MGVKISGLTETTSSNDVDYMVITRTNQNYKIKVKVLRDEAKRYTDNAISTLASKTYVDNKCSTLAETSYVDNKCSTLAETSYVDSKCSTLAETSYVNAKYDELVELINSSKEVIANAITEMGVETDATVSFEVMAENIKKIGK